jgi:hypothetical protein
MLGFDVSPFPLLCFRAAERGVKNCGRSELAETGVKDLMGLLHFRAYNTVSIVCTRQHKRTEIQRHILEQETLERPDQARGMLERQ